MSMSKIISRDDVEMLQRWVNTPNKAPSPAEEAQVSPAPLITAQQLEEIQQQAHKEGYEAGYAEGVAGGKKEIQQKVAKLEQILRTLQKPLEQLDDEMEEQLLTLALTMAKQIIRRELKVEPEHVIGAIREATACLPLSARNIQVLLHPDDAQVVRNHLSVSDAEEGWKIVDNPTVTRGGCRIVTESSTVDATLERRLSAVAAQLLGGQRSSDVMVGMEEDGDERA